MQSAVPLPKTMLVSMNQAAAGNVLVSENWVHPETMLLSTACGAIEGYYGIHSQTMVDGHVDVHSLPCCQGPYWCL